MLVFLLSLLLAFIIIISIIIIILTLFINLFYPYFVFYILVIIMLPLFIKEVEPCQSCTLNNLVPGSIGIKLSTTFKTKFVQRNIVN